jgi:outer membrane lipoprotein SlyB
MQRLFITVTAAACAAVFSGCATNSPDVVSSYQAQRMSTVVDAVVLSVRPVTIDGSQSGLGATAGAVVGGVAGSSVGGYRDSLAAGVIGAVVGGVVGNTIERGSTRQAGVEIIVQLRNGERRAVVQAVGNETFVAGDSVMLINTGGRVNVTKTPVMLAPAAPPAPVAAPASVPGA